MKKINMEILSDAIHKYIELSDSNKDRIFEREEVEQLIKLISIDPEYFIVAPYIKLLLLDNYEAFQNIENKNNKFYKDPSGKMSYWDFKRLLDVLENKIADKLEFKEDTTIVEYEDEKFNSFLQLIKTSLVSVKK